MPVQPLLLNKQTVDARKEIFGGKNEIEKREKLNVEECEDALIDESQKCWIIDFL